MHAYEKAMGHKVMQSWEITASVTVDLQKQVHVNASKYLYLHAAKVILPGFELR